jgi:polysaccharide biosynthesis protein PslH
VRILCITDEYPWPATRGYRIRAANAVRGLAEAGSVDLFCVVSERPDLEGVEPEPEYVSRVHIHHRAPFGPTPAGLARWVTTGWPRPVAWRDWSRARAALRSWAEPPYDVVWYYACGTYLGLRGEATGKTIVDLNDLEDDKLLTLMRVAELEKREGVRRSVRQRVRRAFGAVLDRHDVGRWARVQRQAAAAADAVIVCSERDRDLLGGPRVAVVPNSYDPATPAPPTASSREPVFTMVGLLTYPPNADAARFFVEQIWPVVRKSLPQARFQLVGRHDGALSQLGDVPGVELTGEVQSLDDVFAQTTAVVVPLRAGGGTRIKILEAFARGLPVVASSIGAEGLEVEDETSILIADAPDDFARACIRLAEDRELAGRLARAGHAVWASGYRAEDVREAVRLLALEYAGQSTPRSGSASQ